jgi:hypothetical protein
MDENEKAPAGMGGSEDGTSGTAASGVPESPTMAANAGNRASEGECPWCSRGLTPVVSSLSPRGDWFVHPDTPFGRKLCVRDRSCPLCLQNLSLHTLEPTAAATHPPVTVELPLVELVPIVMKNLTPPVDPQPVKPLKRGDRVICLDRTTEPILNPKMVYEIAGVVLLLDEPFVVLRDIDDLFPARLFVAASEADPFDQCIGKFVTCDSDRVPHIYGPGCRGLIHPHEMPTPTIIQDHPDELDWVNAWLRDRGDDDRSFLGTFCLACLRADAANYSLLRLPLAVLMHKYPARRKALEAERRDR